MTAIIDIGGGQRSIYGAGVFDRLLDESIEFDCCIGVSAGSANVASYTSKQKGRNYKFYTEYTLRKEYMSAKNLMTKHSIVDLDFIYSTLSNSGGEYPIDFDTMSKYNGKIFFVATDLKLGKPHYFEKTDLSCDNYKVLNASSALPVLCSPCEIDDNYYFDGGITDPIPFNKAFEEGCDKVVVIITRPTDYVNNGKVDMVCSKLVRKKYSNLKKLLINHCNLYNDSIKELIELEKQGKCLIVYPDDCCNVDTLTKNISNMDALYKKGYKDAEKIFDFIK